MKRPPRKEPNPFYARRYRRYDPLPIKNHVTDYPQKRGWVKRVLVHIGLFIAGLVVGTIAGLIVLSLLERWLNGG